MPTKAQKGLIGEQAVEKELNRLPTKEYYLFYDLLLRHGNGNTAQIDFVVVSCYGIFIVEVKNYKGTIIPAQYKSYVKQITPNGEFLYPNPLNQNKWHSAVITAVTGIDRGVFPVVVFCGANSVKLGDGFLTLNNLVSYILSYRKEIFTKAQFADIVKKLALNNIYDEKERAGHIAKGEKESKRKTSPKSASKKTNNVKTPQ